MKFKKFSFIPSGVTPEKFKNLRAFVTYDVNSKEEVIEHGKGSIEIRTKTKTIFITKDEGDNPWESFELNPFLKGNYFEGDMPRSLASFAFLNTQRDMMPPGGSSYISLDSGAYQTQNAGFTINPEELAKYYNKNGDEGVICDIIPKDYELCNPTIMASLANNQRKNTNKMKKIITRKDFDLINVIQGCNWAQQKAWLDIVWDSDLTHMAIGSKASSMLESLPIIAHLIFDKKVKRLHFLGINSQEKLVLLALISKFVDVTVDGSQAVRLSFEFRRFWTLMPEGKLEETAVGSSETTKSLRSLGGKSTCNCRACKLVPLLDAYQNKGVTILSLLFFHNQAKQQEFVNLWTGWIQKDSKKALNQYIRVFGSKPGQSHYNERLKLKDNFIIIQKYLEYAAKNGTQAAFNKFSTHL